MSDPDQNQFVTIILSFIWMLFSSAAVQGLPVSTETSTASDRESHVAPPCVPLQPGKPAFANNAQKTGRHSIIQSETVQTEHGPHIRRSGTILDWLYSWYSPTGAVLAFLILLFISIFSGFLLRRQKQTNRLLEQQTSELEETRRKAEQANKAKEKFLARLSQDIRTPLNTIMGMTDLLNKTALDREQKEYVNTCRQASNTLLILINDILDLSRVESGNLTLEQNQFELEPMIIDIISYFARKAHEQGLELPVYIDPDCPAVVGDQNRVQQILMNLIKNAIKFTETGEVVVRVHPISVSDQACKIRFEVEDTGIGVPEEKQAHIFERFSQADPGISKEYGGTGLGLAICKHLTHWMDGEIGVESEKGEGSLFWFEIPFDRPEKEKRFETSDRPEQAIEDASATLSDMNILIVDDNETNRTILQDMLEELGASVSTASDGYRALEVMNRAQNTGDSFDLIFIDHHLPDMDGFELAEELQDSIPLARMGIMLTSSNLSTDRDRANRLGFGDYLVKPVSRSILLESINRLSSDEDQFQPEHHEESELPEWEMTDTPPRILIAEDNEHNRKLMKAILKQYPVQMDFVDNGVEALKMAKSGLFDLVFMDVRMPEMSGLEATRELRSWEKEHDMRPLPVIALTAQALEENRRESLESGCNEHITKPVRENLLVNTIRKYMIQDDEHPEADADTPAGGSESHPDASGDDTSFEKQPTEELSVEVDRRFKDFVQDFLDDLRKKCSIIREKLDQEQLGDIADLAHDMKGAGGSFGFDELREISQKIEQEAEEQNAHQIHKLLNQLEHRLDHLSITYV